MKFVWLFIFMFTSLEHVQAFVLRKCNTIKDKTLGLQCRQFHQNIDYVRWNMDQFCDKFNIPKGDITNAKYSRKLFALQKKVNRRIQRKYNLNNRYPVNFEGIERKILADLVPTNGGASKIAANFKRRPLVKTFNNLVPRPSVAEEVQSDVDLPQEIPEDERAVASTMTTARSSQGDTDAEDDVSYHLVGAAINNNEADSIFKQVSKRYLHVCGRRLGVDINN
ncbi:MAG: hypothetical protein ISR65_16105 [Bacteriovoracaceae bacterium]|nr:hypothetical protein [Bacteriovoracaceae bacterium]